MTIQLISLLDRRYNSTAVDRISIQTKFVQLACFLQSTPIGVIYYLEHNNAYITRTTRLAEWFQNHFFCTRTYMYLINT